MRPSEMIQARLEKILNERPSSRVDRHRKTWAALRLRTELLSELEHRFEMFQRDELDVFAHANLTEATALLTTFNALYGHLTTGSA